MKQFFLIVLLFGWFICANAQTAGQVKPLVINDLNGRTIRLSNYKGRVVLINFWATWCAPCRVEIPDLIKLQRQYRGKGLLVIGITYPPQALREVRRFRQRMKMNYPVALGRRDTKLLFTKSEVLPVTVVIDRDGTVCEVIEGILYTDEFDQKVKSLLQSGP